ncbi:MAG: TIGR01777 family protein [Nitrospirales bacterium]|nr:TIGR01777 family protein [Nitrospirales bacterium]
MKIVVSGGTGFIGRSLCRLFIEHGQDVTVLSRQRDEKAADSRATMVYWDGITRGTWERALVGANAVINLAGAPIADRRWTPTRKAALMDSRVGTTRLLIEALSALPRTPEILINGSAIGYYGPRDNEPLRETAEPGSGFLTDLCRRWEQQAMSAERLGTRVVCLRTGMVLGKQGGALPRMLLPFRLFMGGPMGSGDQWISWIHVDDLTRLIHWLLITPHITGGVNAVAPHPVTMREFAATLGNVLKRPSWLPVPALALRLALGEFSTLMTTGQRVLPAVALQNGFEFRYPSLFMALAQLESTSA